MTRNSLDDLFIARQILTSYIDFLDSRVKKEMDVLQNTYVNLPIEKLSSESKVYIKSDVKSRIESLERFQKSLSKIKTQMIEVFQKYPARLSMLSKEQYKNNLTDHQKKIIHSFEELAKYW